MTSTPLLGMTEVMLQFLTATTSTDCVKEA